MSSVHLAEVDRNQRIKTILDEVKREKPLGKCPLFKMTLTFRSFVWASVIEDLYGSSTVETREKPAAASIKVEPLKKLQRSKSASTITSNAPTVDPDNRDSVASFRQNPRKDIVRQNMLSAMANASIKIKTQLKNSSQQTLDLPSQRNHKRGAIPKYLSDRKEEWARLEKERVENLPDPDCPPGHVLMPESEKLDTLNKLQESQQELIQEYNRIPLSKDSLRIRQRRKDLEEQLNRVEEGIRVLSKPKVFVKHES